MMIIMRLSPNPTPSLTKEIIEGTAFNAGMYTCPKEQVKKTSLKQNVPPPNSVLK
jgi:hypothetical protein